MSVAILFLLATQAADASDWLLEPGAVQTLSSSYESALTGAQLEIDLVPRLIFLGARRDVSRILDTPESEGLPQPAPRFLCRILVKSAADVATAKKSAYIHVVVAAFSAVVGDALQPGYVETLKTGRAADPRVARLLSLTDVDIVRGERIVDRGVVRGNAIVWAQNAATGGK